MLYLVYSIVNEEPNAEECKTKIKAYEEAHRTEIVIRQSQRADEERAIQDRIASEQREAERRKREYEEGEKAIAAAKRKFKQESAEVLLGVGDKCVGDFAFRVAGCPSFPILVHFVTCRNEKKCQQN